MNRTFLSKYLPLILLGGLLLTGLMTIFTQADNYGISVDEPLQDQYGRAIMEWYYTLGKDKSFLTAFPAITYMPEHGGIFDAIVVAVQQQFPPADHWHVRRIVTALTGLLGVVAIALCGYELGGYWVAFLAALALWLYPRYYGAIYNNPKDIPAAVTTMFVLWAALLLIKQWRQKKHLFRNSALLGVWIGVAASIRVTAVIWFLILGLVALGWWLQQGRQVFQKKLVRPELLRQGVATAIIGGVFWLTMIALWPYVFLNPVGNLLYSIKVLSQYPWDGLVLYNGMITLAPQLPRTYVLEWLVIGSPPTLILFALLGIGIAGVWCIKKRVIDPKIALVLLSLLVPLGAIIGLHSILYNGLRQILFLVPSLILLAVYGLVQVLHFLGSREQQVWRWAAAGVAILTLFSYVLVVKDMVDLSPFEYTYFSPVIGGLSGAEAKFETDYWTTCTEQATEWLMQNYRHYTDSPAPSVEEGPGQSMVAPFLLPVFHKDKVNPDFYIASTRINYLGKTSASFAQAFPTYKIIHVVATEGVPFCVVKINPAIAQQ